MSHVCSNCRKEFTYAHNLLMHERYRNAKNCKPLSSSEIVGASDENPRQQPLMRTRKPRQQRTQPSTQPRTVEHHRRSRLAQEIDEMQEVIEAKEEAESSHGSAEPMDIDNITLDSPNNNEAMSDLEDDDESDKVKVECDNQPGLLCADKSILEDFKTYVDYAEKNFEQMPPDILSGISLMQLLNERRVPLLLYDEVSQWHVDSAEYAVHIPRSTLMTRLEQRYNMQKTKPFVKNVELPHSGVTVDLVCHDALAQIQSMLTDPHIRAEQYLFDVDNPFTPP